MLKKIPIKYLLIAAFLLCGLIPLEMSIIMAFSSSRAVMKQQAFRQLESVRNIKKNQVIRFYYETAAQLRVLSQNPIVTSAVADFKAIAERDGRILAILQKAYIQQGIDPPESYRKIFKQYNDYFRFYAFQYGYEDIFLLDARRGYMFFTIKKAPDLGVYIKKIDLALKEIWHQVLAEDRVVVGDTQLYSSPENKPAQFMAVPVHQGEDIIGVIAVQISPQAIDRIMRERSGMGTTGETYLVGPDFKMRSDSFLDLEKRSVAASLAGSVPENGVDTPATRLALGGQTGSEIITDYNGQRTLSAFAPVHFDDLQWAIIAEIDESEINRQITDALRAKIVFIVILSLVLLFIGAFLTTAFINRGINNVIVEMRNLIQNILRGHLHARGDKDQVSRDFEDVVAQTNKLVEAFVSQIEAIRKLEEVVQSKVRMEAIGALAGGIAHDFNNILNYMLTYADRVQSECSANPTVRECMPQIITAIERSHELVSQVLIFSRSEESKKQPLRIVLVIREALKLLQAGAPPHIRLQRNIQSDDLYVLIDPTQLYQIVMNCCTNSFHAMDAHGGRLKVSLEDFYMDAQHGHGLVPGRYAKLTIADTGCGMDDVTRQRMMDPFFTTKPPGQGTGMGMAITGQIIQDCKGAIQVTSTPGEGTSIDVFLPLLNGAVSAKDEAEDKVLLHGRGTVLFVDDEPANIKAARIVLEPLGYSIVGLDRSREALEIFSDDPEIYDLVITDFNMPELDGIELSGRIRHLNPKVPIIIISAYTATLPSAALSSLQIADVIPKPYDKSTLSRAVHRVLSGDGRASDGGNGIEGGG